MPKQRQREFLAKIVGVTQSNPDGSSRQHIIASCRMGENVSLRREPWNRHDKNAIAVHRRSGEQLGYLDSDLAEDLAPIMDSGTSATAVEITNLTGGGWFIKQTRGVNIRILATWSQ